MWAQTACERVAFPRIPSALELRSSESARVCDELDRGIGELLDCFCPPETLGVRTEHGSILSFRLIWQINEFLVRDGRLQRHISALFPTGRCWLAITIPVSLYFVLLAIHANQSPRFSMLLKTHKLHSTPDGHNEFTN